MGQSMIGGVDPADIIEPDLVHYATFDGKQIPAWLYRPTGGGKFPVLVSIHGGPEAQERPSYAYNGLYQYLLNRGFGILAPNIRGSTGYGISYQKLIHRDWGGAELKDIEQAAIYLRGLDWADANRIAIFGGSFGGFATLSALTRLPEYWAAGVDLVGPSNLVTFVNSVPEFWKFMMKEWVGDAVEDRDFLIERSPITYVEQIRAPMLVIQGAKDPRVVKAESDQMVARIQKAGGDVRYYVDENEGHGTTRRENAIKWMKMVAEYLEAYLLDEA
jgi:dipeptidyl aminopeptidase/acylaminoacyl peptidase